MCSVNLLDILPLAASLEPLSAVLAGTGYKVVIADDEQAQRPICLGRVLQPGQRRHRGAQERG
jgi:hypothetical protein